MRSSSGSRREAGSAGRTEDRGEPAEASSAGRRDDRPPLDTLTQPSAGMRQAMAEAVVGDERASSAIALEERAADLLGQEDAVYLRTATMNQIALRVLSSRATRWSPRPWRTSSATNLRPAVLGLHSMATPDGERHLHGRAGARRRQPTGRPTRRRRGSSASRTRTTAAAASANRPPARGRCRGETARAPHPSRRGATHERRRASVPPRQSTAGVRHRHALSVERPRLPMGALVAGSRESMAKGGG